MSHHIYQDPAEIPGEVKVLGIWVRIPRFLFATDAGVQEDLTISEMQLVYVELSEAEWNTLYGNQAAINALGQALGPEIAAALGGYVKGWDPGAGSTTE